jgi:integrase
MIERDRLVLVTLVATGLRRSELIALDWGELDLDGLRPSLLVRAGKGGRPRRQPLAPGLAAELRRARATAPAHDASAPLFTGLAGGRLQPTILAGIVHRAADRSEIDKHVTAHTLRHTAATWLRQHSGDARLVAEYLGHADLSTVSRSRTSPPPSCTTPPGRSPPKPASRARLERVRGALVASLPRRYAMLARQRANAGRKRRVIP